MHTQPEQSSANDNAHDMNNSKCIGPKKEEKNYISLYTQLESQDINDISYGANNSENKENNDPEKQNKDNTSMYTKLELKDIDDADDVISKPNSFTLGEVRQALNNGSLDDIFLPTSGPVYRTNNSSKKTGIIEFPDDKAVKICNIQVK